MEEAALSNPGSQRGESNVDGKNETVEEVQLRISAATFAKHCSYFISLKCGGGEKVRTEVCEPSKKPEFTNSIFNFILDGDDTLVQNGENENDGGPSVEFGAFVVLADKDGGGTGSAKLLGSAQLNMGAFATRMRNGETVRTTVKCVRMAKDGETELLVGKVVADVHIVGVGNGILPEEKSIASLIASSKAAGIAALGGAGAGALPNVSTCAAHAYGVTGVPANIESIKLEYRLLNEQENAKLSSIDARLSPLLANIERTNDEVKRQIETLAKRFRVVWRRTPKPVHASHPADVVPSSFAAFFNTACSIPVPDDKLNSSYLRIDVVDASPVSSTTSLGSVAFALGDLAFRKQYRGALQICPCPDVATAPSSMRLHASLDMVASERHASTFLAENIACQVLQVDVASMNGDGRLASSSNAVCDVRLVSCDAVSSAKKGKRAWGEFFPPGKALVPFESRATRASEAPPHSWNSTFRFHVGMSDEMEDDVYPADLGDPETRPWISVDVAEFGGGQSVGRMLAPIPRELPLDGTQTAIECTWVPAVGQDDDDDDSLPRAETAAGSLLMYLRAYGSAALQQSMLPSPASPLPLAAAPSPFTSLSMAGDSISNTLSPAKIRLPPPISIPRPLQQQPSVSPDPRVGEAVTGIRKVEQHLAAFAKDSASKQALIDRLLRELDTRRDAINDCGLDIVELRQQNTILEDENARLNEQVKRYIESVDDDAGVDDVDVSKMNVHEAKQRLVLVTRRYKSEKSRNDEVMRRLQALHQQTLKRRAAMQRYAKLEHAHQAQAKYIVKLQSDISKMVAYKETIKTQQRVIAKLEGVLKRKLSSMKSKGVAQSDVAAAAETAKLRARALEEQLIDNARTFAQEIASLKLRIMELETDAAVAATSFAVS